MNAQLLVQSLQGTRAQILFAFLFAGRAMDVDELMRWTGRDRKTHYVHLNALCSAGLLASQTMAHGRVTYLLGSEMLPALRAWSAQLGITKDLGPGAPQFQESENRTPGTLNVVVDDLSLNLPTIATITTTSVQESENRTPVELAALKAVLDQKKIIGKKRTDLMACPWVTAEYVQASVRFAEDERCWDNPIGMAITRMLDHVEVSEEHPSESNLDRKIKYLRERGKLEDTDTEDARRKYVSGKYSSYIEH